MYFVENSEQTRSVAWCLLCGLMCMDNLYRIFFIGNSNWIWSKIKVLNMSLDHRERRRHSLECGIFYSISIFRSIGEYNCFFPNGIHSTEIRVIFQFPRPINPIDRLTIFITCIWSNLIENYSHFNCIATVQTSRYAHRNVSTAQRVDKFHVGPFYVRM